jgi:hypothetical protein
MTVTTAILAIIRRLLFGARVRHYVDGREVPNYRKGETMKTKKPEPKGKKPGDKKPKY